MSAVVTELTALRSLRVGGVAVVQEYAAELGPPPGGAGIVLVPWPNRVAAARWTFDGVEQRLDVTEPKTGNASHGLLRNTGYAVPDRSESAITLGAPVFPQHGYPFHLGTSVRYALVEDGLSVTHTLVNHGVARAPVAVGAHPYLCVGDTPVEELVVTIAASSYAVTTTAASRWRTGRCTDALRPAARRPAGRRGAGHGLHRLVPGGRRAPAPAPGPCGRRGGALGGRRLRVRPRLHEPHVPR